MIVVVLIVVVLVEATAVRSGGDTCSGDAVMILFVSHTRTQVPWYLTAVRTSWYAYHMHMSYTA